MDLFFPKGLDNGRVCQSDRWRSKELSDHDEQEHEEEHLEVRVDFLFLLLRTVVFTFSTPERSKTSLLKEGLTHSVLLS